VAPFVAAIAAPATGRTVRAIVVVGRSAARRSGGTLLRDGSGRGEAGKGEGDDSEELHLERVSVVVVGVCIKRLCEVLELLECDDGDDDDEQNPNLRQHSSCYLYTFPPPLLWVADLGDGPECRRSFGRHGEPDTCWSCCRKAGREPLDSNISLDFGVLRSSGWCCVVGAKLPSHVVL